MFARGVEVGDESSFERFEGRVAGGIGAGAGGWGWRTVHNGIEHNTGQHACGAACTRNHASGGRYGCNGFGRPVFPGSDADGN